MRLLFGSREQGLVQDLAETLGMGDDVKVNVPLAGQELIGLLFRAALPRNGLAKPLPPRLIARQPG